jgi:hypothetical protein
MDYRICIKSLTEGSVSKIEGERLVCRDCVSISDKQEVGATVDSGRVFLRHVHRDTLVTY